ncbi:MarR family winged helix-turn-helix transcriptional regulator [Desulforapulum autotrophicum]|nr:MarR family winged helix-turn-helix transcriptional regulator [Desulforapulum autotrophicum]
MSQNNLSSDKRIFYKLNISQRILLKYVDREITNRLGVSVVQTATLFYLLKHDGCLLKDLSRAFFQNKSATTTLVERMVKNGLIVKKQSETDGRAAHIFLTDKGRDINEKTRPLVAEYNSDLVDGFTDTEIGVIHRFLDRIIENYS